MKIEQFKKQNRQQQNQCSFINPDGKQCRAPAYKLSPAGYCYGHSQNQKEVIVEKNPFKNSIIQQLETGIFSPLFTEKEQEYYSTWKVVHKAIFGLPLNDDEFETFKKISGRTERPSGRYYEFYGICGRRGFKTFSMAILLVRQAIQDWSKYVKKGEVAEAVCVANDKAQASVLLQYTKRILDLPGLKNTVSKIKRDSIVLKKWDND